ncbi:hypothetical protein MKQ70_14660 [Chitinophaga sedimenti]|uniref:hypothetical protein n=1 Tax=Chitinophaga sedimenti TaxID=2033606 RepID=UPI002003F980|nr:hypothetical protein [Chitinophaga sedimenti]MCK7556189.1 hypothetical protein [Chitinophaga sedimenti]
MHNAENDASLRLPADELYELDNLFEDRAQGLYFLNAIRRVIFYNGRATVSDKWKNFNTDKYFFLRNDSIYRPLQPFFRLSSLDELKDKTQTVYTTMPYGLQEIGFIERIRQKSVLIYKNIAFSYTRKDAVPFLWGVILVLTTKSAAFAWTATTSGSVHRARSISSRIFSKATKRRAAS